VAQVAREYQSIGEVLVALKPEFPDVTISKIRFLESEGLISPERTSSGYRKFYDRDVRRLRTILKLQRDEYLPLKVIRERLDGEGDGAEASDKPTPVLPEPEQEEPEPSPALQMTADELGAAAGLPRELIDQLASFGLLRPSGSKNEPLFDGDDLVVARVAKDFFKYGVESRHLTMYRHFADREATFFQQIVMPTLRQRNPEARRLAGEALVDLARAARRLKHALLRANLRGQFPG
jgi:DNA-binding transcriptional MerR regulator